MINYEQFTYSFTLPVKCQDMFISKLHVDLFSSLVNDLEVFKVVETISVFDALQRKQNMDNF